jgi:hypothetical protein
MGVSAVEIDASVLVALLRANVNLDETSRLCFDS